VFRRTTIRVSRGASVYVVNIAGPEGHYNPAARNFQFVIKSAPGKRLTVRDAGRVQSFQIR